MLTHLFLFLMSHPYQSSKAGCMWSFTGTRKKHDAPVFSFPPSKYTGDRIKEGFQSPQLLLIELTYNHNSLFLIVIHAIQFNFIYLNHNKSHFMTLYI